MNTIIYDFKYGVMHADGLQFIPFGVCCALWPDFFFPDGIDDPLCTPSVAVSDAHSLFWGSPSYCRHRFPSYLRYLQWLIEVIGGDAPAFSAAFLDELHKLERPSSSLRL